jgi:hypothetical protein
MTTLLRALNSGPGRLFSAALLALLFIAPAHAQDGLPESCRDGLSSEEVAFAARQQASFVGLGPPQNAAEIAITKLEALTAEEHDRRYEEQLMGGIPVVEPWECYWRVELEGIGRWCGSRAPGRCEFFRNFDIGISGANGEHGYYVVRFADDMPTIWLPLAVRGR